jgi:hypothetical protein
VSIYVYVEPLRLDRGDDSIVRTTASGPQRDIVLLAEAARTPSTFMNAEWQQLRAERDDLAERHPDFALVISLPQIPNLRPRERDRQGSSRLNRTDFQPHHISKMAGNTL